MEKAVKVLLADDSEHFGKPCAAVMRAHSLEVQVVMKDGRQVLNLIEQSRPDVVIMDFFLPHLDAIGVLRGMQRLHLAKRPQVMIMSSFDNPNLEREALLAGADYYFLKPFDADEMAERILTLNGKSRVNPIQRNPAQSMQTGGSLEMRVTTRSEFRHISKGISISEMPLSWQSMMMISSMRLQNGFTPLSPRNTQPHLPA